MKIIVLNLCPAFDMHCFTPHFAPYHENLTLLTARDAGGKGLNLARALQVLGISPLVIHLLGEDNAEEYRKAVAESSPEQIFLTVPGRIRENITLHTTDAPETRISFPGFPVSDTILGTALDKILAAASREMPQAGRPKAIVTLTGRLPEGLSRSAVSGFLDGLHAADIPFVIDSRSFSPKRLREARPFLIKPNEEEIEYYTGEPVHDPASACAAAEELRQAGIENVMISLGGKGAVLASASGTYVTPAPPVEVRSTVGAGDSSIAGFLYGFARGLSPLEALQLAVSCGSAACLTEGSLPPRLEDIELLFRSLKH